MTYHLKTIQRGQIGEFSKIIEELDEFTDALQQSAKVMAIIELSDMYGAIDMYLAKYYQTTFKTVFNTSDYLELKNDIDAVDIINHVRKMFEQKDSYVEMSQFVELYILLDSYMCVHNLSIHDLHVMSQITKRVFESGHRT